jgi:hypothetical protein
MLLLMSRCIAFLFVLSAVAITPALASAQASPSTVPSRAGNSALHQTQAAPNSSANGAPGSQSQPTTDPTAPLPQQIVVTGPPATVAPWTWHDKVLWGAILVLVILGYIGVLLALRTLKNIQRQTEFGVAAAQAALQCANAALESSQAIVDSGRPWIVVTVEPFLTMENGFKVMATNRGRTPARIVGKADCVKTAVDETQLPAAPDYATGKSSTPFEPIILLPGESAGIRPFRRADVRALCTSDEDLKKIETWQQKVFVYGRIEYRDLISPLDQPNHETDWCCWYVYGEKDALVIAGPPEYNKHI